MEIFSTRPIRIDKSKLEKSNCFLNADGEEYLPFDGNCELDTFIDETGERFFCSFDGEKFYNAKGEKVFNAFKKFGKGVVKVGKGAVKAGKFVGRVAKKVARAVVSASKKVVSGVKTVGGKAKSGVKKLIHHKKSNKVSGGSDSSKNNRLTTKTSNESSQDDVFTKELPKATPSTSKENVVEIDGKKFDATDVPKGKEVVETIDENGNKIAGVEYLPQEVVAVTGKDGNIEYHTPDAVGMSKNLKLGLIIGGSVLGLALIGFVIYKFKNKSK